MIVTKEIDDNKHYKFPSNIKTIEHDGKFIVIAVDFANWIVLKNKEQVNAQIAEVKSMVASVKMLLADQLKEVINEIERC